MKTFYPDITPYKTHRLKVSDLHELYIEECGNPDGSPVVFLHGGPGSGVNAKHRRYFDPKHYRIVLFDQRGAGQSTPHAELRENTTWDLVADMEKIRTHLNIQNWHVFGGSWGSTLALAYAETHSERVKSLCLRGIFLCRKKEIDWFYQSGTSLIFPDFWEPYQNHIPENERHDYVSAYYKRLTSSDADTRLAAARIWSVWEASTSKLIPDDDLVQHYGASEFALAFARIECHYFINRVFFESDNWLIENAHKIQNIPTVIVQGRYDVICPVDNAWELKKALPNAKLHIVADAGHSALEVGIVDRLVQTMDEFRSIA